MHSARPPFVDTRASHNNKDYSRARHLVIVASEYFTFGREIYEDTHHDQAS